MDLFRILGAAMVTASLFGSGPLPAAEPAPLKDLMTKIVEPTSNAIFYISRDTPQNEDEWKLLQGKALMLLESANLLTLPGRYREQTAKNPTAWSKDAKLLLAASAAAYQAANAKNADALGDLNDQLYTACTTCHEHFLPQR